MGRVTPHSQTKPAKIAGSRRRLKRGTKARKLADMIAKNPKIDPAKAAQLAGYAPATSLNQILATRTYKEIALPVETQRAAIQRIPGFTLADAADYAKTVRDTSRHDPRTGLVANSQLIDLLNYNPIKTVNIRETRLIAELKDISSEDLRLLIDDMVSSDSVSVGVHSHDSCNVSCNSDVAEAQVVDA